MGNAWAMAGVVSDGKIGRDIYRICRKSRPVREAVSTLI